MKLHVQGHVREKSGRHCQRGPATNRDGFVFSNKKILGWFVVHLGTSQFFQKKKSVFFCSVAGCSVTRISCSLGVGLQQYQVVLMRAANSVRAPCCVPSMRRVRGLTSAHASCSTCPSIGHGQSRTHSHVPHDLNLASTCQLRGGSAPPQAAVHQIPGHVCFNSRNASVSVRASSVDVSE